jgi:Asp-tRNA(Asn)/Glu-tRNA(Gln) amidotransferase A subunit family amidase
MTSLQRPVAYGLNASFTPSSVIGRDVTTGRVNPIELTIDHLGPITRTVSDAALMLSAIAGRDGEDPRQPTDLQPEDYSRRCARTSRGMRIGVVAEGFGTPGLSDPGVDDAVRAAVGQLRDAGMQAEQVEIPWHRHGMHIWNVIATDGATVQMLDGNGYGHNWDGRYDPELIAHYGSQRQEVAPAWPETVKLVAMAGGTPSTTTSPGITPWPATRPRAAGGLRRGAGVLGFPAPSAGTRRAAAT